MVWDGCRPDMVNARSTPYLWSLAESGVVCSESRVAYPPQTRVSSATFVTGCYPDRHTIAGNAMYVPEINRDEPINTGDRDAVLALSALHGGRLFPVPALSEALADAGLSVGVVSTASPGSATIVGTGAGFVWGRSFCLPENAEDEIIRRFGPRPTYPDTRAQNGYAARVAAEYVLPEVQPDVLIMWLCEPDTSLHHFGFDSPEAKEALAHNDEVLRTVHERMGGEAHVLVLSDHGHTPLAPGKTNVREVVAAALQGVPDAEFVVAADGVYFAGEPSRRVLEAAAGALQDTGEIGPILADAPLPGVLPLSSVRLSGPHAPHIKFSYLWRESSGSPDGRGYVLTSPGSRLTSSHGAFAPTDMHNMLIAQGPRFRSGAVSTLPCGLIDVAPTVLSLFGVVPPDAWDGRILWELYGSGAGVPGAAGGAFTAQGPAAGVTQSSEIIMKRVRRGQRLFSQEVALRWVNGTCYLDRASVLHEEPPPRG